MIESRLSGHTENIFLPREAVIKNIIEENSSIKTFVMEFSDKDFHKNFTFIPGHFLMVSLPDHGEAPISIASAPGDEGLIDLSVRRAGRLTSALHEMNPGDVVGLRGPLGRPFPMDDLKHRDLVFVAGGIGLAPLRSVILYCLDKPEDYGQITLLYGSRTPSDIAFKNDLDVWDKTSAVDLRLTVDIPEPEWNGNVGLVTTLLPDAPINKKTCALLCGPPIMINAVSKELGKRGVAAEDIITTMERNMKCGVGLCGHCHMGGKLVCKHGPVFSVAELEKIEGAL